MYNSLQVYELSEFMFQKFPNETIKYVTVHV